MWPSLIAKTYFPFVVTIFTATCLKCLNEILSPSDACLMCDYHFKGTYASFICKSVYVRGSLLSMHANYNICSMCEVLLF